LIGPVVLIGHVGLTDLERAYGASYKLQSSSKALPLLQERDRG
jgi:hypothetical protein